MSADFLYNIDEGVVLILLFVALMVALEIGSWLGRKARAQIDDAGKSQANSL